MFKKEIQIAKIVELSQHQHKVLINGETAGWIIRHSSGDNWVVRDTQLNIMVPKSKITILTWEEAIDATDLLPLPTVLSQLPNNPQPNSQPERDPQDWRPGDTIQENPKFTVLEVEYRVWVEIERITTIANDEGTDELYDNLGDPSSIGSFPTLEEARKASNNTCILGMNPNTLS